jgi:hypothetical protein
VGGRPRRPQGCQGAARVPGGVRLPGAQRGEVGPRRGCPGGLLGEDRWDQGRERGPREVREVGPRVLQGSVHEGVPPPRAGVGLGSRAGCPPRGATCSSTGGRGRWRRGRERPCRGDRPRGVQDGDREAPHGARAMSRMRARVGSCRPRRGLLARVPVLWDLPGDLVRGRWVRLAGGGVQVRVRVRGDQGLPRRRGSAPGLLQLRGRAPVLKLEGAPATCSGGRSESSPRQTRLQDLLRAALDEFGRLSRRVE